MGKNKIRFELLIHDLKVPLAVIETGMTSLIDKEDKYGPLTEKQLKVLKRALRNTKVIQMLVNDALEVGRSTEGIINKNKFALFCFIEQALVEVFDLNDHKAAEIIRKCMDLAGLKQALSERNMLLDVDEDLWLQEIFLDECKMRQILRNLLTNALKYRKKRVEIKIEKSNGFLLISVGDDGNGIPASYHQKIFECYFQIESGNDHCVRGHGLGLAGVMILVEDMGGKLYLDSGTGKGTKFLVKVPLNKMAASHKS